MKKLLIFLIGFYFLQGSTAQEMYFLTGKNITSFDYKDSEGNKNENLQAGSGSTYEVGFTNNLGNDSFTYSVGVALNQYNALGSELSNSYRWETEYLGLNGSLSYNFITSDFIVLAAKGSLGFSTIIYGKQEMDGEFFDLKSNDEFKGIFLHPSVGLVAKSDIQNDIHLSLGYNYSKSFNLLNSSEEKLSINNSQIQFGIHFFFR